MTPPLISLLHATYHRSGGPSPVKEAWLGSATVPERIEYIFAMDADDTFAINSTQGELRSVGYPDRDWVTAVRNWNAAAAISSGELLFVIADDLSPETGWDSALRTLVSELDPEKTPFAIKVTDNTAPDDTLMRHPIVSRAFYRKFGLFDASFRGVYADDDITLRSFWSAVIVDGRKIRFQHQHPTVDPQLFQNVSQSRINRDAEFEFGYAALVSRWPKIQRVARIHLASTNDGRSLNLQSIRRTRRVAIVRERLLLPLRLLLQLGITRRVKWKLDAIRRPTVRDSQTS
jgi:hypothetical protein